MTARARPWMKFSPTRGCVYFITCEELDYVKIGYTAGNPAKRLSQLQVGNPFLLELALTIPGSIEDEKRFHEAFSALRENGEWFRCVGKLQDFIFYCDGGCRSLPNAIGDVLGEGMKHPLNPMSDEEYAASGDRTPFAEMVP